MEVKFGSRTDVGSRQLDRGDVDDHFITASEPPYQPPRPVRDLASFIDGLTIPFGHGDVGRVHLPPTPDSKVADPLEESDPSSTKSSRQRKRRRYIIIGTSITLWFLLVVIYIADVNRSWRAQEDKWKMDSNASPVVGPAKCYNTTMLWGHSHNDEMHGKDAFDLALGLRFGSIEADTWLVDSHGSPSLMVGHVPVDLKRHRTLQSVYLEPIFRILEKRNMGRSPNETWIGLLEDDPTAEVQLVIDFKSGGSDMWPFVLDALEPLSSAGYLTTYDQVTSSFTRGPLTIIGTGNTPLSHVFYSSPRIIFYDAPLRKLRKPVHIPHSPCGPAIQVELDETVSPMASAKIPPWTHIGTALYPSSNAAVGWMRRRTDEARKRGIKSRWWGAANQPAWLRRRMWALQREARTDWINGDDLRDLAKWLRQTDGGP